MHNGLLRLLCCLACWLATRSCLALQVDSDFEGASVHVVEIDEAERRVDFMPGGDPARGWPCWWFFRLTGFGPGETITLRVRGSTATVPATGPRPVKPLAAEWAMPTRATFSLDGKTWQHTAPGTRVDEWMVYTLEPDAATVWVAWGPPYTPAAAEGFVRSASRRSPHAEATELCRSRDDRGVPMLRVREGDRRPEERFGIWVQARQHAWECGSSWVAQGFAEWLLADDPDAAWLRQHADIFIVPVMDVDNTATGNGGKDARPQDHNRDWSEEPHWNEVAAARRRIDALVSEGRMDLFLDLHNPSRGAPTFFYALPADLLPGAAVALRDRFIELACSRISLSSPLIRMSRETQGTGPDYDRRWRQMSANWVNMHGNPQTVSLCLETCWNSPGSTADGYRAVGAGLAASVRDFLVERRPSRQ